MFRIVAAAAFLIAGTGASAATVIFSDDFDAEAPRLAETSALANWQVIGNVDVVQSGTFGITCQNRCIDLDGTTGPGEIRTIQSFAFGAGDTVTFSFDVSGSQRSSASDEFFGRLLFGDGASLSSITGTGGFSFVSFGPITIGSLSAFTSIAGLTPFSTWSLSFTAAAPGSARFALGTTSADNIGPLVDNVVISLASGTPAIPEPATWAMMIAGFGLVGAAARRRRGIAHAA